MTALCGCLFLGYFDIRMEVGVGKADVEPPRQKTIWMEELGHGRGLVRSIKEVRRNLKNYSHEG